MTEQPQCDCLIVGGGFVGMTMAALLQQQGLSVVLVEAKPWHTEITADKRAIALSGTAKNLLQAIDFWPEERQIQPIKTIHISERGSWGFARLNASDYNRDALGYLIKASDLLQTMRQRVPVSQALSILAPATVSQLEQYPQHCVATIQQQEGEQKIAARLVIAAEGVNSSLRQQLDIATERHDFDAWAIVGSVSLRRQGEGVAFERFTPSGPLAFLPLGGRDYAFVWSLSPSQQQTLINSDDKTFLKALQQEFGYRLGRLEKLGPRQTFPLCQINVSSAVQQRVVLLGSAARHFHPAAGQGLNLSLRDCAFLAESLNQVDDIGAATILQAYQAQRQADQQLTQEATNILVRLFGLDWPGARFARACGLTLFDALAPLKETVVQHASGINGIVPRLACGLPLSARESNHASKT